MQKWLINIKFENPRKFYKNSTKPGKRDAPKDNRENKDIWIKFEKKYLIEINIPRKVNLKNIIK